MPRNKTENKTHRFVLPLTESLYSAVENRAKELEISQAEFIRRAINAKIP